MGLGTVGFVGGQWGSVNWGSATKKATTPDWTSFYPALVKLSQRLENNPLLTDAQLAHRAIHWGRLHVQLSRDISNLLERHGLTQKTRNAAFQDAIRVVNMEVLAARLIRRLTVDAGKDSVTVLYRRDQSGRVRPTCKLSEPNKRLLIRWAVMNQIENAASRSRQSLDHGEFWETVLESVPGLLIRKEAEENPGISIQKTGVLGLSASGSFLRAMLAASVGVGMAKELELPESPDECSQIAAKWINDIGAQVEQVRKTECNGLTREDGTIIRGQMENGLLNGLGEIRFPNATVKMGMFSMGELNGPGFIIFSGAGMDFGRISGWYCGWTREVVVQLLDRSDHRFFWRETGTYLDSYVCDLAIRRCLRFRSSDCSCMLLCSSNCRLL
ncbi:hypothetical protein EBR96_05900 [bacterium]|nr:hypothetical protein [bacterium]